MSTQTSAVRTTPIVPPGRCIVDPAHSTVGLSVNHMGVATVRGRFTEFEGTLEVANEFAHGRVKVASITTGDEQRDAHLRSPEFFDAKHCPEITFESTRIEPIDDESSQAFGNLAIHAVTREVKHEVVVSGTDEDLWGNTRVGLEAVGVINRSDFDMKFNQALGSDNILVGDKVTMSMHTWAVQQA